MFGEACAGPILETASPDSKPFICLLLIACSMCIIISPADTTGFVTSCSVSLSVSLSLSLSVSVSVSVSVSLSLSLAVCLSRCLSLSLSLSFALFLSFSLSFPLSLSLPPPPPPPPLSLALSLSLPASCPPRCDSERVDCDVSPWSAWVRRHVSSIQATLAAFGVLASRGIDVGSVAAFARSRVSMC